MNVTYQRFQFLQAHRVLKVIPEPQVLQALPELKVKLDLKALRVP